MKPYKESGARTQINRLRKFAPDAARFFGIEASGVRILNHGFNSTFKITDPSGRKFAMRMNIDSGHDRRGILAELQWVRALAGHADFQVPEPVKDEMFTFTLPGESKEINTVLYRWLDGPDLNNSATPESCFAMGRALQAMHLHTETFRLSGEASVREMPDLLWGTPFQLDESQLNLGPLKVSLERGERVMEMLRRREPSRLIHGDVHFGNTKWRKGRLAVFDFDDCVFAWPENDLGITLFYLRGQPQTKDCEVAFREGYGEFKIEEPDMEALVACRAVMLANELSISSNARIRAWLPTYMKRTDERMRLYLETGFFDTSAGKELVAT